jgi:hypothetical protein
VRFLPELVALRFRLALSRLCHSAEARSTDGDCAWLHQVAGRTPPSHFGLGFLTSKRPAEFVDGEDRKMCVNLNGSQVIHMPLASIRPDHRCGPKVPTLSLRDGETCFAAERSVSRRGRVPVQLCCLLPDSSSRLGQSGPVVVAYKGAHRERTVRNLLRRSRCGGHRQVPGSAVQIWRAGPGVEALIRPRHDFAGMREPSSTSQKQRGRSHNPKRGWRVLRQSGSTR